MTSEIRNEIRKVTAEYAEYLRDESRSVGQAETISFAKNEQEIVDTIRLLAEEGRNVTVQGARTGVAASAVPRGGHILNIGRMNKILGLRYDQERNCYFLRVQPGVLLSQVRKALATKSFDINDWDQASIGALSDFAAGAWMFSPDPTETSASIGGMASCNASGARTFGYGPTRGYIEALRVVLAGGDVLALRRGEQKALGRDFSLPLANGKIIAGRLPDYHMPNVKNASGYYVKDDMDLIDLFIGAEGSLGVISELELRLLPVPVADWGVSAFFADEATALAYVQALRNQNPDLPWTFRPAAIEFFNHDALDLLRAQKANYAAFAQIQELKADYHTAVYAEFHGNDNERMRDIIESLGDLIEALGGNEDNTWVAANERDMEKLLFFRHAIPESVNMLIDQRRKQDPTITKLGSDMAVPDQYLVEVMKIYNQELASLGLQSVIFGHVGNNHLHVNIIPRDAEDYKAGKQLYLQWAQKNVARGGTVSAEHGVGKLKVAFLHEMFGDHGIAEMRRLKQIFDPQGMINNGNMFNWKEEADA